jgi:hypothetical protein
MTGLSTENAPVMMNWMPHDPVAFQCAGAIRRGYDRAALLFGY